MKVAIMQPYFFPYLGYFSLIKHTERFIILDTVQYIKDGWIARNRILKQGEGWRYINVPIMAHAYDTLIRDAKIHNETNWKSKIVAQFQPYKKNSSHYERVIELLNDVFSAEYKDIVSLNVAALNAVLEYLKINRKIEVLSQLGLDIKQPNAADEWSLRICQALGNISEYWNPPGGKTFFDRSKYENNGIKFRFHEVELTPYYQKRPVFEPGLSILDALMFNSVADVHKMLDNFSLS